MTFLEGLLSIWLPVAVLPFILAIATGMLRLRRRPPGAHSNKVPIEPLDVVIPLKGTFPDQATILSHMLGQNYPDYRVIFVLESERDPAAAVVDQLVQKYQHARKVIGGVSVSSAQKNHSLLAGLRHVRPEARILVFCDSTNIAHQDWLERFTAAVRSGEAEAVTTFRSFKPEPETLGAVCQAIYGTFVLLLAATLPKPWGGATAIRRETFERLNVAEVWAKTVVDDLVLGNALERGGVAVRMDTGDLLTSPLHNQTVQGFLSYLDRQILFPKFTNPGIWLTMLIVYLNLTVAFLVSLGLAGLFAAGWLGGIPGLLGCGFLVTMLVVAEALRGVNPFRISAYKWLVYFVPCMFFHAFVVIRSVFRNHIDWHGRRYWPGKEGVIVYTGFTTGNCSRELVLPPGTNARKFRLQ
jgi:ceramide glucosyltransferase